MLFSGLFVRWRIPGVGTLRFAFTATEPARLGRADVTPAVGGREVRALSLATMRLRDDAVVWDVGAGSGSVAIEASRLPSQGQALRPGL